MKDAPLDVLVYLATKRLEAIHGGRPCIGSRTLK
jgi:hypothetical protein